ncbi:MAG: hypothetical protein J6J71_03280 [Prevotella sp.]|nr:hypothetical protein [Prevotella sp.]
MPLETQALLDIYKENIGMSENEYIFMSRLLRTAFQEGRLDRIKEEYNRLNPNDNAEKHTIQHIS